MIALPAPVACPVACGAWDKVLILIRWHISSLGIPSRRGRRCRLSGPLFGWPPEDAGVWNFKGYQFSPGVTPRVMTPEVLGDMSASLRDLGSMVEEHGEERQVLALKVIVEGLDTWSKSVGLTPTLRYDSLKLLQCIRACTSVEGGPSGLEDTIKKCIALQVPEALRGLFVDASNNLISKPPSRALIQRYELSLDVALMILEQKRSVHSVG